MYRRAAPLLLALAATAAQGQPLCNRRQSGLEPSNRAQDSTLHRRFVAGGARPRRIEGEEILARRRRFDAPSAV